METTAKHIEIRGRRPVLMEKYLDWECGVYRVGRRHEYEGIAEHPEHGIIRTDPWGGLGAMHGILMRLKLDIDAYKRHQTEGQATMDRPIIFLSQSRKGSWRIELTLFRRHPITSKDGIVLRWTEEYDRIKLRYAPGWTEAMALMAHWRALHHVAAEDCHWPRTTDDS